MAMQVLEEASKKSRRPLPAHVLELESQKPQLAEPLCDSDKQMGCSAGH